MCVEVCLEPDVCVEVCLELSVGVWMCVEVCLEPRYVCGCVSKYALSQMCV